MKRALRTHVDDISEASGPVTSQQIMSDPSASTWLKNCLQSAMQRDPVDAANDAQVLAAVLDQRAKQAYAGAAEVLGILQLTSSE